MPDLTIEPLSPDQFRLAYPLIREAMPGLQLSGWLRYARQTTGARRAGRAGIVAARRSSRPYPCGLFCYRVDRDLFQERVLIAEHFVAVDMLDPNAVMRALVAELDRLGARLDCRAVRSIVHSDAGEISGGLALAGHVAEGTLLFKPLDGATPA
jgi:hypothetical protein